MTQSVTSFWYAIYKKLWSVGAAANVHTTDQNAYGGFSLRSTGEPNGIFGTVNQAPYAGQKPLKAGDIVPDNNPLYALLAASLAAGPPPPNNEITVNGENWPIMPWPPSGPYPKWLAWNNMAKPPRLIDMLHDWIAIQKKADDTPKGQYLDFSYVGVAPPAFPLKPKENAQILFVGSYAQDNGVRPGNVPPHYWNSARIYVTDTLGADQGLPEFKMDSEYYIAAVIGNSGNLYAGTAINQSKISVQCNAYVFNTFMSPGFALPSLDNLSVLDANTTYEQLYMTPLSRDVVGFRFVTNDVYKGLYDQVKNFSPQQLGGGTPDDWLKGGHACVKVWITGGELPSAYNGQGADWPTDSAIPSAERRIAQRNLAKFDMSVMAAKKIHWQTFMMSQAGGGLNALKVETELPAHAVRCYLAAPIEMYRRYVAKGGSHRGFEPAKDVSSKPFPDAVILRQTTPGARLEIAQHERERFFGMALGIEVDPAAMRRGRVHDIDLVHISREGRVVGGFTLRGASQRTEA